LIFEQINEEKHFKRLQIFVHPTPEAFTAIFLAFGFTPAVGFECIRQYFECSILKKSHPDTLQTFFGFFDLIFGVDLSNIDFRDDFYWLLLTLLKLW